MKGNAQECQGNVQERMQIARVMQGNGRGTYGSGCKAPGECRGMQGNAGECQGNVWECKLPGECRECRGMPGERMAVGV